MANKTADDYIKDYTHPELRERLKTEIKQGDKGGKPGQWSARKSQLLKKMYEQHGGSYTHEGTRTASQKSLHQWSIKDRQQPNKKNIPKK